MKHYTVDLSREWDHENGFYLTCETSRIGKFINHLEIYQRIAGVPGDVFEFGVYKGASLVRLLAFRDLLEGPQARRVVGFDAFGKFPGTFELESDQAFVQRFEEAGGNGISEEELVMLFDRKGFTHYELVKGDIMRTLPAFIAKEPDVRIALLHIDVDVYAPTKAILEILWHRMAPGGVLMLDDYGTVDGETKAVDEFFADQGVTIHRPRFNRIPSYIIKA